MPTPEEEVLRLREEIRAHDRRYYVDAAPTISDRDYDRLLERLRELEQKHPDLLTTDSPTQRVGGEPIDGFETVEHARRMYSIDNTYNEEELRKWAERCYEALSPDVANVDARLASVDEQETQLKGQRGAEVTAARRELEATRAALRAERDALLRDASSAGLPIQGGYFVEPKVDGVAINLRYEAGQLVRALTRGDGRRGDDVTTNVRAIRAVPLSLSAEQDVPDVLEARGEIYMPQEDFDRNNREAQREGEDPMVNPRNGTAGTLKQYDPAVVARRGLRIYAHGRGEISGEPYATQSELLKCFGRWGLPTNPLARHCRDLNEVWKVIEQFDAAKQDLSYGVDGMVVKVDRLELQDRLGHTSRFPRWCIAYKYATEQAATELLEVEWQMGKTGKLTPRGRMTPVFIAGTTVQHATLHNLGEVRRKGLRIGDTVIVEKAGEIIPQVVRRVDDNRAKQLVEIDPPETCPECGGEIQIEYDQRRERDIQAWPARVEREKLRAERAGEEPVALAKPEPLTQLDESGRYCINPLCPAQLRERLAHFAGRDQMDIDGMGEKVIAQLIDAGLLDSFGDIFALAEKREAVLDLERMGEKKADNLFAAIDAVKSRGMHRVLAALGIRHVGSTASRVLAAHYGSLDALLAATMDEIATFQIDGGESGIGPEIARSLHTFLHSEAGKEIIAQLRAAGVSFEAEQPAATASGEQPLAGKSLVVTGTLERFKRPEIEELIRQNGGKATSSVSKSTDYLVAGEKAGSKLSKAEKLGISVISEAQFLELVGEAG